MGSRTKLRLSQFYADNTQCFFAQFDDQDASLLRSRGEYRVARTGASTRLWERALKDDLILFINPLGDTNAIAGKIVDKSINIFSPIHPNDDLPFVLHIELLGESHAVGRHDPHAFRVQSDLPSQSTYTTFKPFWERCHAITTAPTLQHTAVFLDGFTIRCAISQEDFDYIRQLSDGNPSRPGDE
jgi:hypothetical protein